MILEIELKNFLKQHYSRKKLVLLALSGGPDSLCLFYLLKSLAIPFAIAHVDHGWRQESGAEAETLCKLAQENGIPFHLKKLVGVVSESACREERLQFFAQLLTTHQYEAVILGHQKDDQIETVAKRLFEGASLPNLTGMQEVSLFNGMPLWRPLLNVEKREILQWIANKGLSPFYDSTNDDTTFLRNRMRHKILPNLAQEFGKDITHSMLHLGEEAKELNQFMMKHMAHLITAIECSNERYFINLSKTAALSLFELKYLIRYVCSLAGVTSSRNFTHTAAELVQSGVANKMLHIGNFTLNIDRGRLFLFNDLKYNWKMTINEGISSKTTDWQGVWKGEMKVALPKGEYTLGPAPSSFLYPRTSPLSKWWNNHKVPIFLAPSTPVLWQNGKIVHEFLTGKIMHAMEMDATKMEIVVVRENQIRDS